MPQTILYVDDDFALARLAERHLGRAGYKVVHAPDQTAAMQVMAGGGVDAVVLDHYLQAGIGLDFLHRLKEQGSDVPVIYVTGSSDATIAIDALKSGASDYVIKTVGQEFWPLMESAIEQGID